MDEPIDWARRQGLRMLQFPQQPVSLDELKRLVEAQARKDREQGEEILHLRREIAATIKRHAELDAQEDKALQMLRSSHALLNKLQWGHKIVPKPADPCAERKKQAMRYAEARQELDAIASVRTDLRSDLDALRQKERLTARGDRVSMHLRSLRPRTGDEAEFSRTPCARDCVLHGLFRQLQGEEILVMVARKRDGCHLFLCSSCCDWCWLERADDTVGQILFAALRPHDLRLR